jgi:hypothetical protein
VSECVAVHCRAIEGWQATVCADALCQDAPASSCQWNLFNRKRAAIMLAEHGHGGVKVDQCRHCVWSAHIEHQRDARMTRCKHTLQVGTAHAATPAASVFVFNVSEIGTRSIGGPDEDLGKWDVVANAAINCGYRRLSSWLW